jgi:peptidoglycan-associated lipoprotein
MYGCSSASKGNKDGLDGANGLSEQDLAAQNKRFGGGNIPLAEGEGLLHDVHFDYDSSVVTDQSRQDIEYNANVLREHGGARIQLEGHTDERGTGDYNMALGASRAKAVKDVLTSLGVSDSQIGTISYGKEVPLDPGHNEAAWSKNRRVHFAVAGGEAGRSASNTDLNAEAGGRY